MADRSDAEVICGWIEPKPLDRSGPTLRRVRRWILDPASGFKEWVPIQLDLNALREVEEKLADEQVGRYDALLRKAVRDDPNEPWVPSRCHEWHASAEQKIKALAQVIRAGEGR